MHWSILALISLNNINTKWCVKLNYHQINTLINDIQITTSSYVVFVWCSYSYNKYAVDWFKAYGSSVCWFVGLSVGRSVSMSKETVFHLILFLICMKYIHVFWFRAFRVYLSNQITKDANIFMLSEQFLNWRRYFCEQNQRRRDISSYDSH